MINFKSSQFFPLHLSLFNVFLGHKILGIQKKTDAISRLQGQTNQFRAIPHIASGSTAPCGYQRLHLSRVHRVSVEYPLGVLRAPL